MTFDAESFFQKLALFGRDTAQSASNAIAGGVSGNVDLITAILSKMGVPGVEKPVGGSSWMEEKGLTRKVPQGPAQILGETLGMAGPSAIAARGPEVASALLQAGKNLQTPRMLPGQTGALQLASPKFDPKNGIGAVPFNQDIDYFGFVKEMPGKEFLRLAKPAELDESRIKWLMQQMADGKGFGNPFLNVKWLPEDEIFKVIGHEGRHRVTALQRLFGNNVDVPVHIFPQHMRARDLTDQMRQALFLRE